MSDKRSEYYVYCFTAPTWCAPCMKMDKDVWPHPKVKAELKQYRTGELKIFPEEKVKSDDNVRKFYEYYNITTLPTLLIVDARGQIIKKSVGGLTASQTIQFLGGKND